MFDARPKILRYIAQMRNVQGHTPEQIKHAAIRKGARVKYVPCLPFVDRLLEEAENYDPEVNDILECKDYFIACSSPGPVRVDKMSGELVYLQASGLETTLSVVDVMGDYDIVHRPKFSENVSNAQNRLLSPELASESQVWIADIPRITCREALLQIAAHQKSVKVIHHPNSQSRVLDVLHPSFVLKPHMSRVQSHRSRNIWGQSYLESMHQWIPSSVDVAEDGTCKFVGEVVGMRPSPVNASLTEALEKLFARCLPSIEKAWTVASSMALFTALPEDDDLPEIKRTLKSCEFHDGKKENRNACKTRKEAHAPLVSLKGRRLQVYVKITECTLSDENGSLEGVWHLEGIPNEEIVTSSVCVLQQQNIFPELKFQRRISQCEGEYIFWNVRQERPQFIEKFIDEGRLPLGKYSTAGGEIVTFPNSHIHKSALSLTKGQPNGTRTTVVFWLRNPALPLEEGEKHNPKTFSEEQILSNLNKIMMERKVVKNALNIHEIHLCEH